MKKLFIIVAILMMATSSYALNETHQAGPQNITECYAVGTTAMTSGNVVVLQGSSPTYPGAEVTGTSVAGHRIYGVVVDQNNYSAIDMVNGKWIRVQTYGYNSAVKVGTGNGTAVGPLTCITASATPMVGQVAVGSLGQVTSNVVSLESKTIAASSTIKAFQSW